MHFVAPREYAALCAFSAVVRCYHAISAAGEDATAVIEALHSENVGRVLPLSMLHCSGAQVNEGEPPAGVAASNKNSARGVSARLYATNGAHGCDTPDAIVGAVTDNHAAALAFGERVIEADASITAAREEQSGIVTGSERVCNPAGAQLAAGRTGKTQVK
jgi:hypothetical protein